ncbi:MAG: transglycosylase domain-containing protein [Ruminococcus flavefaciens]|nr:transglycosylase domain-containing protein [Ruminococcus flavefaciens]MCM1229779.1 transglycosylase domain-containing protein [Ruminococcus flavefaciens]
MANSNYSDRNDDVHKKKRKKKKSKAMIFFQKLCAVIVTTLLSLFLVIIITGTIVSTALTVYVLSFMDEATSITLTELESGSDTYFYGTELNEDGEEELVVLRRMKTDVQRIPVSIDRIPQHTRDAFTCTEDERFYLHDGVDYKRTFSAFLNLFLHFYNTEQGGSTITQQLIKNLTGASGDRSPQQKIREIFAAMQLEKTYSKDEILEEYLNYIGFGGPINGIQLASTRYFGKDVEELTIAESAVLAAIPQNPNYYYPFADQTYLAYDDDDNLIIDGKANNKIRQEHVLWQMYKNGAITYDEYQEALAEKIMFTDSAEYKALHPEVDLQEMEQEQTAYTWEVDAMMWEAAGYLMELYNIDEQEAITRINKGGYRVYSTIDRKMQDYVEEKFLDMNNFLDENWVKRWVDIDGDGETDEVLPHVAFTALRYDGSVMATVGQWGEKKYSLVTNYAARDKRQIGSTIKPVSTYGLALETDHIHWGSTYKDSPLEDVIGENGKPWPTNYGNVAGTGAAHQIYYFLQQSFNTVPAQLCQELTPEAVYEFSTEKLGLDLYGEGTEYNDRNLSPLSIGALTWGVTLQNLVGAYVPYGNNGTYYKPHVISKIEDANHNILIDNSDIGQYAVSEETAWVMNRLLKNVVENGTGTTARLSTKVLAGKTGTTEDWSDSVFVGLTRDFASGITIGYEQYRKDLSLPSTLHACSVWKNIIGDYAQTEYADTPADFDPVESVIQMSMCSVTGNPAGEYCPRGVTGYWKSTNFPVCTGNHYYAPSSGDSSGNSGNNSSSGNNWGTGNGGDTTWSDPGTGGSTGGDTSWTDPGTGGSTGGDTGWVDPGTGGSTGGDTGWGDPGTGGSTGGDTGFVDPGTGGDTGNGGDVATW